MKKIALYILVITSQITLAQVSKPYTCRLPLNLENESITHKSIHQEQSEKYAQYNFSSDAQWDSLRKFETGKQHPTHPPAPFEGGQKEFPSMQFK